MSGSLSSFAPDILVSRDGFGRPVPRQPAHLHIQQTFFFFFSFISLIADGPHHYHPACGHKGSSHLSPVHALQFFYRDASSALLQLVNQWLNFTYSRSHAFRYERKNTNPTSVRIELTTSVLLADVQLTTRTGSSFTTEFLPISAAASIHSFMPPYAIGSVPSLPGHAIAYQWRFTAESPPAQGRQ